MDKNKKAHMDYRNHMYGASIYEKDGSGKWQIVSAIVDHSEDYILKELADKGIPSNMIFKEYRREDKEGDKLWISSVQS